jgi:hypothetical protein
LFAPVTNPVATTPTGIGESVLNVLLMHIAVLIGMIFAYAVNDSTRSFQDLAQEYEPWPIKKKIRIKVRSKTKATAVAGTKGEPKKVEAKAEETKAVKQIGDNPGGRHHGRALRSDGALLELRT